MTTANVSYVRSPAEAVRGGTSGAGTRRENTCTADKAGYVASRAIAVGQ